MAVEIPFRREFSFEYGRLEPVAPMIRRIVARNPSPFTFRGTGTYVVGRGEVAVIEVAELTVKLLAATPPKDTPVAPVKLVPVMLTLVPPAVVPLLEA